MLKTLHPVPLVCGLTKIGELEWSINVPDGHEVPGAHILCDLMICLAGVDGGSGNNL